MMRQAITHSAGNATNAFDLALRFRSANVLSPTPLRRPGAALTSVYSVPGVPKGLDPGRGQCA